MPAGRPEKITDEMIEILIGCVKTGLPLCKAAQVVRITHRTLDNWLKTGEDNIDSDDKSKHKYIKLFLGLKEAESSAITRLLTRVEGGAPGWQGSAWILERRWWQEFAKKQSVSIDSEKPHQINFNMPALTKEIVGDVLSSE